MVILENIDIDIDIDKAILQNIDIDKISNRFKFGISNRATPPLMAKFPDIFSPHFFSFAIESYIYETDFTLQKYHF